MYQRKIPVSRSARGTGERSDRILEAWSRLLALDSPQRYPRNVDLFRQGETPKDVFLLVEGAVKLVCTLDDGRETLLALRGPGQLLDYCSHFVGIAYPFTATTLTISQIYRVDFAFMLGRLREGRELPELLVRQLVETHYRQSIDLVNLKILTASERFESVLRELAAAGGADPPPGPKRVSMFLTDSDLAELLGLSTRQLRRVRDRLVASGRLHIEGGVYTLLA